MCLHRHSRPGLSRPQYLLAVVGDLASVLGFLSLVNVGAGLWHLGSDKSAVHCAPVDQHMPGVQDSVAGDFPLAVRPVHVSFIIGNNKEQGKQKQTNKKIKQIKERNKDQTMAWCAGQVEGVLVEVDAIQAGAISGDRLKLLTSII